jgi:uncharacterized protein (DUF305 family)
MITHHPAAILISEQSKTKDPDLKKLQQPIISGPTGRKKMMKAKLNELQK